MGTTEKALELAIKKMEQERDQVTGDFDRKIDALIEALSVINGTAKKAIRKKAKKKVAVKAPKKRTKKTVKAKATKAAPKKAKKAAKKSAKKANGTPRNGTLQKAIVDVLAASKKPIHVSKILETLATKGHKIEKRNLATRLSTMKKGKLVDNSTSERGFWYSA